MPIRRSVKLWLANANSIHSVVGLVFRCAPNQPQIWALYFFLVRSVTILNLSQKPKREYVFQWWSPETDDGSLD